MIEKEYCTASVLACRTAACDATMISVACCSMNYPVILIAVLLW